MSGETTGHNYIVTHDVGQKIEVLRHLGFKTPDSNDPFYAQLEAELIDQLREALPDKNIIPIRMADLSANILGRAHKAKQVDTGIIVSTCAEIAEPMKGIVFEINRLIGFDGRPLGFGPRPGNPPLMVQIKRIKHHAGDEAVILVEDGVFSGSTLEYVVDMFLANGINLTSIVVGFAFSQAKPALERLERRGVEVHTIEEFNNLLDWVPDHDFFPLTPNCGKVIGVPVPGGVMPYYSQDGATYSVPYIIPFGPMVDWASIPLEKTARLSRFCFSASSQIYTKLQILNPEKDVRVCDIVTARRPISIPVAAPEARGLEPVRGTVRDLLNKMTHDAAFALYRD